MTRAYRRQIDDEIIDRAAALFARHGFADTSLKALADAAGLSKPGLLHHYPSKETLYRAVMDTVQAGIGQVLQEVDHLPGGLERDRLSIELLADFALERPGLVALATAEVTRLGVGDERDFPVVTEDGVSAFEVFDVDPIGRDNERIVRVIGTLSALGMLSLAAHHFDRKSLWRRHIVNTCLNTLGYC